MSMTDYPSGSKLNPISEEIHQRDVAHHNWLRDVVISKEKYQQIMALCILSWAIYPAYVLDYILYKLDK